MVGPSWSVGEFTIAALVETDAGPVIEEVITDAVPEEIAAISWLQPSFVDEAGHFKAVVQAFLITTGVRSLLIDACVGNHKTRVELASWNQLNTDFLDSFEKKGVRIEDVDRVICTHLHFDHVGWCTKLTEGAWKPTFPNARYVFVREEFDYWNDSPSNEIEDDLNGFKDSILPVVKAEQVDLVDSNQEVVPGVTLIPTPGHTPAHVSVLIESKGQQALITGDAIHHPCQIAKPAWGTISDSNQGQAIASRLEILERFADSGALIIGSHFASPSAGYLVRDEDGFRLDVLAK